MRPFLKLDNITLFFLLTLPIISFIMFVFMFAQNKNAIGFPVYILTDILIFLQLFILLFFAKEVITQIKLSKLSKILNILLSVLLFVSIVIIHLSLKKAASQPTLSELNGFEKSYISYLIQFKTGIYIILLMLLILCYYSIAKQLNKINDSNTIASFLKLCFTPLTLGWIKRKIQLETSPK